MEPIEIPKSLVKYFRELDHEEQGTFWLNDNKVSSYNAMGNFSNSSDDVIGFFSEAADGIVHNHTYDSPFSREDIDNMLPSFIYVLITPSEVFSMLDKEYITCNY